MADAKGEAPQKTRYKRSAKNYLLDRHFQLKYTGYLVGIALLLSCALGTALYLTSSKVVEQSNKQVEQGRATVRLGQETVSRGQEVLKQSQKVNQVVAMNIAEEYADDPELAATFSEAAKADEQKLLDEQTRLEKDAVFFQEQAAQIEQQAEEVERGQRMLLIGIVAGLTLLVLFIGVAGIVLTHRVAGPVFKMKRLLREVGKGKFIVQERLRKGDELQHFFEAFEDMVGDLRDRQEKEIKRVDEILNQLGQGDGDEAKSKLKRLRADMQSEIEA